MPCVQSVRPLQSPSPRGVRDWRRAHPDRPQHAAPCQPSLFRGFNKEPLGGFTLNGITLGTFAAIILYQIFGGAPEEREFEMLGDDAEARAELRATGSSRSHR